MKLGRVSRLIFKILAVLAIGTALGLAATWATVTRGILIGGVYDDGPWRTNLSAGSSESGPYLRARVAVNGIMALGRAETIYYIASRDSDGEVLNGRCSYRIEGSDPPSRWWSITAYGLDHLLIPNAAGRYSVSMNSVARGQDGRFLVALGQTQDGKDWIPVADGGFDLALRLYNPAAEVAADPGHVPLPVIRRISCG